LTPEFSYGSNRRMRLSDYIRKRQIKPYRWSVAIGKASGTHYTTVLRTIAGKHRPRQRLAETIIRETGGAVGWADLYDL